MPISPPLPPPRPRRARALYLLGVGVLIATVIACGSSDDAAGTGDGTAAPSSRGEGAVNDAGNRANDDGSDGDASSTADARPADDASKDAASGDASGDAGPLLDAGADAAVNDDPFDPASCGGLVLTSAQALAMLGGSPRSLLASATLQKRARACAGATIDTCGPWGGPAPHTQALLTYSGGVVTDYKTFAFPTHLVLFAASGQPKLSVRHASDYQHDGAASTRGVVFPFGADPMVNGYPIIYVWDFAPAPNRYDDLQGLLGSKGELYAREHCARVVFTSGLSTEIAALYRY